MENEPRENLPAYIKIAVIMDYMGGKLKARALKKREPF